jgi:spore maturation protein CgeB
VEQDIDVFFFATIDSDRENEVSMMISDPSMKMDARFLVSGIKYATDLRKAEKIPMLPFSLWRYYACRSKINLNITRERHASTYTSTSRPFELAAMGCCIVSSPYKGLDKWFRIGAEIFVANSSNEAIELYNWLIDDEDLRRNVGLKARKRVLSEHTSRQRAKDLLEIINKLK